MDLDEIDPPVATYWDEYDLPAATLTDRQRAILTDTDDSNEITDRAQRAARQRIRERLRATIFDLHLIVSEMPLDDIDKALSEPDEFEMKRGAVLPLASSLPSLPALLYLYHRKQEIHDDLSEGWRTALDVKSGIWTALNRLGIAVDDITVSIEIERRGDISDLASGDLFDLSRDELVQLHQAGLITVEELADALDSD